MVKILEGGGGGGQNIPWPSHSNFGGGGHGPPGPPVSLASSSCPLDSGAQQSSSSSWQELEELADMAASTLLLQVFNRLYIFFL